jgi:precorrin-3B methylase
MNLFHELKTLLSRLDAQQVDYALCGGLAMAVYAFPRATLDIDLMIRPEDLDQVKKMATDIGFITDAGLMRFKDEKIKIYRLTKLEKGQVQPLMLDLLLVSELTRNAWESRHKIRWDEGKISVVSPRGLIYLKSLRKNGQDQDDIRQLRSLLDED